MQKPLSAKIQAFCREYVVDLNGKQAAIRAGYSPYGAEVQASRLLTNVNVQVRIQELMDKRSAKTEINAEYVLNMIKKTLERCDAEGDSKGVFKGTELLGKHLKLFTDVVETTHTFTQMGDVKIGGTALTFDVGEGV